MYKYMFEVNKKITKCVECNLYNPYKDTKGYGVYCNGANAPINQLLVNTEKSKPKWCPLKEVLDND